MLSVPCYRYMDTINLYLKSIDRDELFITVIDIESAISLSATKQADSLLSMLPVRYKEANLECRLYNETIFLGGSYKTPVEQYTYFGFKIEYNKYLKHNSIAAFGRNARQTMSLAYQLYRTNKIMYKEFSFDMNNQCMVYFGHLSATIRSQYKYSQKIETFELKEDDTVSRWNINMEYIAVGNDVYFNNDSESKTYFSSIDKNILVPRKAFNFLVKTLFKDYFGNEGCRYTGKKNLEIICDCDDIVM